MNEYTVLWNQIKITKKGDVLLYFPYVLWQCQGSLVVF